MAGLYLHIPFCASRCIYCGFYSTTALDLRQQYVDALCREMEMRGQRSEVRGQRIETVYLGGGTPSQLTIPQLHRIFDATYKYNKVEMDAEVTIEMNPDDVTEAFADALCMLPVNRISMGAQTFSDERLRWMRRRHTSQQVAAAIERLRDNGIHNISIDLMYGFPGETLDDWQRDIDQALALDVEHISAYCLMIEEDTPLWRLKMKDERLKMPGEELERQMYEMLIDRLTAAGYEHYEISNFARPGYRSRHNSSYWHDIPYIGLGAAAHSYSGKERSWNVADLRTYIDAINRGERPYEEELLDADTHYNDRIATALRTSDGLDLTTLSEHHRRYCLKEAQRFIDDGLLRQDLSQGDSPSVRLVLTRKGLFVSDMVMSGLMLV
jgi:oxygen-independent coproporphyrinogen-3 oxidase